MSITLFRKHRIHYKLEGESGQTLVLYPPFMLSLDCWKLTAYVEALKGFQLILIDPLGQGRSDSPLDPSLYTIDARAEQLFTLLNELQINQCHFLGMEMGGQVGFAFMQRYPNRLLSLSVAAAHPYPLISDAQHLEEGIEQLRSGNISAYLQQWRSSDNLSEEQQNDIKKHSHESQALGLRGILDWKGVVDSLRYFNTPASLFTAVSENRFATVREAGRAMRRTSYIILPKMLYNKGLLSSETTIPHLLEFYQKIQKPRRHSS